MRDESHIYFHTQWVIMTHGVRGKREERCWGAISNEVLKFREIIEFQSS